MRPLTSMTFGLCSSQGSSFKYLACLCPSRIWHISVHISAKASQTRQMGLKSFYNLLLARNCFAKHWFWRWESVEEGENLSFLMKGDTEKILPGHLGPLPFWPRKNWGTIFSVQRDVACVGAYLTYIPKNTTSWLSIASFFFFFSEKPSYIVKIFTFNEMVVPVSILWVLLLLSHWIILFIPAC